MGDGCYDNSYGDRGSGLHNTSTMAGSDVAMATVDMSMGSDSGVGPPPRRGNHPGPLKLSMDPSTDIPLDPDLAESHYFDVDDFEADESESEVHTCA